MDEAHAAEQKSTIGSKAVDSSAVRTSVSPVRFAAQTAQPAAMQRMRAAGQATGSPPFKVKKLFEDGITNDSSLMTTCCQSVQARIVCRHRG